MASSEKRSEQVWFDDGTLLLRAEDTLFCVYKGIIMMHSTIFHDMSSLTQPEGVQEYLNGLPVISLQESAGDTGIFLSALHDGR